MLPTPTRRLAGTLGCLAAVGLVMGVQPAQAQLSCGAQIDPTIQTVPDVPPNSYLIGTTVTVNLQLGVGQIQGGTSISIDEVQYALDCFNDGFIPCTDDGSTIGYAGDGSILTDCVNGMTPVVASSDSAGGALPNLLTFTLTPAAVLPANTTCNLAFDVTILQAPAVDGTPTLAEAAALQGGMCDNGLPGNANGTIAIQVAFCGDSLVSAPGETCDPPGATQPNGNACRDDCTYCGDGIVDMGEECDPADPMAPPNCGDDCLLQPICGDNMINAPGETCDGTDAMGCLLECRVPGGPFECTCCGDGIVQTGAGEECDPADPMAPPNCGDDCLLQPICGDNMINAPGETCDGTDAMGCLLECRVPGGPFECTCCGDGIVQTGAGEECDPADPMGPPNCGDDCLLIVGGEGCTPGYWKLIDADPAEASHECNWAAPYTPGTLFCDVFFGDNPGDECAFPNKTLLDVLEQGGGGLKALGRHTVAALLNSAATNVSYDIGSPQGVIDMFNDVYPGDKSDYSGLKSIFAGFNEYNPCPLGNCNAPRR